MLLTYKLMKIFKGSKNTKKKPLHNEGAFFILDKII